MKAYAQLVLVRSIYAYECKDCGTARPAHGACHGCGVPLEVDGRITRRIARLPADWMITLAHNLAIGCALVASFRAGDNFGFHMGSDRDGLGQCTCQWSPGYGEPYRGASRCVEDDEYDDRDDHIGDLDE